MASKKSKVKPDVVKEAVLHAAKTRFAEKLYALVREAEDDRIIPASSVTTIVMHTAAFQAAIADHQYGVDHHVTAAAFTRMLFEACEKIRARRKKEARGATGKSSVPPKSRMH